jgi:copper chaperone CopZ
MELASALVLLVVLVNALRPRSTPDQEDAVTGQDGGSFELAISGMRCNGCVQSVQRALSEIRGVTDAEVRLEAGRATVRGNDLSEDELVEAVTSLGFEASAAG